MIETTGQPILIIGGTGVQGGNVARELLKHNYRVRILSRNPQSAAAQEIAADRKSTRLNSSHSGESRMPSSA